MKVMFCFPLPVVGGVETLFATLCKYLRRCPVEGLVTGYDDSNPVLSLSAAVPSRIATWARKALGDSATVHEYVPGSRGLAKLIDEVKPDICVSAMSWELGKALSHSTHRPQVLETVHSRYPVAWESLQQVAPWVTHIVSVSRSVREYLDTFRQPNAQLREIPHTVITNGVDTEVFRPSPRLSKTVQNYAYFGRLDIREKALDRLIENYRAAMMATPKNNFTLNLYGTTQSGLDQQRVEKLIERTRDTHVKLKGFVEEPWRHYVGNDVIVVRSESEGFCNTAIEALACGIPLVAYRFGGILDHLTPECCLVANSNGEFIQHLLNVRNLDLRENLRQRGLQWVQTYGSAIQMASAYADVFGKMASRVSAKPAVVQTEASAFIEHLERRKPPRRIAAVCSQYSQSIVHAMEEWGADTFTVPYGQHIDPAEYVEKLSGYDAVIFNAACDGYEEILKRIRHVECYALFHSCFCGYAFDHLFDVHERNNLQRMLDWRRQGIIRRLGFVNDGSTEFYKQLGYRDVFHVPNIPLTPQRDLIRILRTPRTGAAGAEIGVFTVVNAMKNTVSAQQLALATGARVHVNHMPFDSPGFSKEVLLQTNKLVERGWMTKEELLSTMARMHLTLMLSFTESYGLLATQSWAVGTPCIVGPACRPLLDGAPEDFRKACYLERLDDALRALMKIELCVKNRPALQRMAVAQVDLLRQRGEEAKESFLK